MHGNQTIDPDDAADIENQIVYTYNTISQITKSEQSHQGAVSSSPSVQYAFDATATSGVYINSRRHTTLTYPSGRVLFYDYGGTNTLEDMMSVPKRLRETNSSGTAYVEYTRNNSGRMVRVDYLQPDVRLDLFGGTTGTYTGFDRFARTKDQRWYDYTSGTVDVARYQYGYDYASNRTWKEDPLAAANTVDLDDLQAFDGLDRLTAYDRGNLNGGKTAGGTQFTDRPANFVIFLRGV